MVAYSKLDSHSVAAYLFVFEIPLCLITQTWFALHMSYLTMKNLSSLHHHRKFDMIVCVFPTKCSFKALKNNTELELSKQK